MGKQAAVDSSWKGDSMHDLLLEDILTLLFSFKAQGRRVENQD